MTCIQGSAFLLCCQAHFRGRDWDLRGGQGALECALCGAGARQV